MRKWISILTCSFLLGVGPCTLDSWNIAVNPGFGGHDSFVGIELDFGDLDFIIPLIPFGN